MTSLSRVLHSPPPPDWRQKWGTDSQNECGAADGGFGGEREWPITLQFRVWDARCLPVYFYETQLVFSTSAYMPLCILISLMLYKQQNASSVMEREKLQQVKKSSLLLFACVNVLVNTDVFVCTWHAEFMESCLGAIPAFLAHVIQNNIGHAALWNCLSEVSDVETWLRGSTTL